MPFVCLTIAWFKLYDVMLYNPDDPELRRIIVLTEIITALEIMEAS